MTALNELIPRTQDWLMSSDTTGDYSRAQVLTQLGVEASRLANRGILGHAVVAQAVTGLHVYPLDTMSVSLGTGTATGGSATTLVDSGQDFTLLGLTVGVDRVRNATDGSVGIVTAIATTVLTCGAGFVGGVTQAVATGDKYFLESPLITDHVVIVTQVYYNGERLLKTTERELDARVPGWESVPGEPKYWLTDGAVRPTELRIVPAPQRTGSALVQIPMVPFVLDWHDNLLLFLTVDAHDVTSETDDSGLPNAYDDLLVLMAAQALAGWQDEYQNDSLAQLTGALVDVWQDALKVEG